jgi:hypothetical protein
VDVEEAAGVEPAWRSRDQPPVSTRTPLPLGHASSEERGGIEPLALVRLPRFSRPVTGHSVALSAGGLSRNRTPLLGFGDQAGPRPQPNIVEPPGSAPPTQATVRPLGIEPSPAAYRAAARPSCYRRNRRLFGCQRARSLRNESVRRRKVFYMWERQDSNLRMGFRPNWFTASLLCRSDARSPEEEPQ